jgi:hypothetical protein
VAVTSRHSILTVLPHRDLRRLPQPLAEELYAGAVALDRRELLASVNATIARREADGTLARWAEALGL